MSLRHVPLRGTGWSRKLYEFWIRPAKPGPKGKATQNPPIRLPCFNEKWFFTRGLKLQLARGPFSAAGFSEKVPHGE